MLYPTYCRRPVIRDIILEYRIKLAGFLYRKCPPPLPAPRRIHTFWCSRASLKPGVHIGYDHNFGIVSTAFGVYSEAWLVWIVSSLLWTHKTSRRHCNHCQQSERRALIHLHPSCHSHCVCKSSCVRWPCCSSSSTGVWCAILGKPGNVSASLPVLRSCHITSCLLRPHALPQSGGE